MRKLASAFASVVVASALSCGDGNDPVSVGSSASTDTLGLGDGTIARARIEALVRRFHAFGPNDPTKLERVDASHFRAGNSSSPDIISKSATTILPVRADGWFTLEDDTTHLQVRFAVQNAANAQAAVTDGFLVYPGAVDGADLVHHVRANGTEDFFAFDSKPNDEAVAFEIDVTRTAGVRLVSNTLEFLDPHGSPRLRVSPPYVIDANGQTRAAALTVTGCAYDANPSPPWKRPVVGPGTSSCILRITWNGVKYPALVDPGWTSTGSMSVGRRVLASASLASGEVLVVGGTNNTLIWSSAELYDPVAGVFAATGSMGTPRRGPTATALSSGNVLVTGGYGNNTYQSSAEIYDATTGTFSATTGPMTFAPEYHSAVLLGTGKVLVTGGWNLTLASPYFATANLFDPANGSFAVTGSMATARYQQMATLLSTGRVLVTGGFFNGTALSSTELYDPIAGTFSSGGSMTTARFNHTATSLPSNQLLIAGGTNGVSQPAELYDPIAKTFTATGSMIGIRSQHTATLLPTGKVLLAGGAYPAAADELFDPALGTFGATVSMPYRFGAVADLLGNGDVLVAGGDGNGPEPTAYVYDPYDLGVGGTCKVDLDCHSGFCADGVCCDSHCTGQCEACDVAGHAGVCTPVIGAPHGSRAACTDTEHCAATCDGTTTDACTFAIVACGSTCSDGTEVDNFCDNTGACSSSAPRSCNNLACANAETCRMTCSTNDDCQSGFTCDATGACVTGAVCTDDHTSKGASGPTECAPYKCGGAGTCLNKCTSVDDCISPNACDTQGECTAPSPSTSNDSGGCNASGAGAMDGLWSCVVVALVSVLRVRARRTCVQNNT